MEIYSTKTTDVTAGMPCMKSYARDKRYRTYCKQNSPCPTLSQYTNIESFGIFLEEYYYFTLQSSVYYTEGWNVLQSVIKCTSHISFWVSFGLTLVLSVIKDLNINSSLVIKCRLIFIYCHITDWNGTMLLEPVSGSPLSNETEVWQWIRK